MGVWLLPLVAGGIVTYVYFAQKYAEEVMEEVSADDAESEAAQLADDRAFQMERMELQERLRSAANLEARRLDHTLRTESDGRKDEVRRREKEQERLRQEAYLSSLWGQFVDVRRVYTFRDFPGKMTLTLASVSVQGLKFHGVRHTVPFPLVESCEPHPDDIQDNEDDEEEEEQ